MNYWLHGYHTPKGVGSQLSFGAGLGSRCWVDTEQPRPSSPDISPCAQPALLGEGLLSSPLQGEQQPALPPFSEDPSDSDAHAPMKDTVRTAGEALLLIYVVALRLGLALKQPCILGEVLGAKRLHSAFRLPSPAAAASPQTVSHHHCRSDVHRDVSDNGQIWIILVFLDYTFFLVFFFFFFLI